MSFVQKKKLLKDFLSAIIYFFETPLCKSASCDSLFLLCALQMLTLTKEVPAMQ